VHTGGEGVRAEKQHEEESFEQTLQRCLQEALTVDPEHPVCDPE
jgi:hypothetical protein